MCFGNDLSDIDYNKLLSSYDIILLKDKSNKLLKRYQQLDKEIILYSKAKKTNANIFRKKQLEKEKEKTKLMYISMRKRINEVKSNSN